MQQTIGKAVLMAAAAACAPVMAAQTVSHGRFQHVPVYLPDQPVQRVVMWFRGEHLSQQQAARIEALRRDGAMVMDVDSPRLAKVVAAEGDRCGFSSGDVENFSRFVQAYFKVPTYRLPILGGDGDAAGLAYVLAAQADAQVVAGVVTEGFCPTLAYSNMICGTGIEHGRLAPVPLSMPWLWAQGSNHARCDAASVSTFAGGVPLARPFKRAGNDGALPGTRAAITVLGQQRGISLPPVPQDLDGLPLVEVAATATAASRDVFAIFLSGDGGWAGLDKDVAGALAGEGIPVVGVDSLRYFWSARTPAGLATDLDRIARYYARRWGKSKLLLIGFSQGADVLPAAINHLSAATQAMVQKNVLLSVGHSADYEFHVSNWLGSSSDKGLPIAPEVAKLDPARTLCVYGKEDDDALCPTLKEGAVQRVGLPGDHHFEGDYAGLARVILQNMGTGPMANAAGSGPAK